VEFEVRLPYPLTLAKRGNKRLVLFLEKPVVIINTERPWSLLPLRGIGLFEGRTLVAKKEDCRRLTVLITSFEPRPSDEDPEEVFEQLLSGEGSCWKELWGHKAMVCGNVALVPGSVKFPPLGFGTIRTRVDSIGPRIRVTA